MVFSGPALFPCARIHFPILYDSFVWWQDMDKIYATYTHTHTHFDEQKIMQIVYKLSRCCCIYMENLIALPISLSLRERGYGGYAGFIFLAVLMLWIWISYIYVKRYYDAYTRLIAFLFDYIFVN